MICTDNSTQRIARIAVFGLALSLLAMPNTARADEETPPAPKEKKSLYEDPDSSSIRVQKGTFVGALGSAIIETAVPHEAWHSLGVRAAFTAAPSIAIVAQARTSLLLSFMSGGANWYWFDSAFTPYLYGRLGGFFVLHIPAGGSFQTGLGLEYAAPNGFTVGLEGGFALFFGAFDDKYKSSEDKQVGTFKFGFYETYVVIGYRY